MKITAFIFGFLVFASYGQKSVGNYLMINNWTISHIQLKKDGSVIWYTAGCTDQGAENVGSWTQNGDTVRIFQDSKLTTFIVQEKTLCHLNDKGVLTEVKNGIPKTWIRSKWRIHNKAKRIRRRK